MDLQHWEQRLQGKRRWIETKLRNPDLAAHVRVHAADVELPMIDGALQRIRSGEYGECLDCGETIESDRLAAIPEITTCKGCGLGKDARVGRS